ncbi:hypothetical protein L1280_002436 [Deinococcus sp. HSC-46F16]|uniref:hypothetical protein n=1 Tax=Deinococcus sp. HSC-46F16 TaxID=2910968 RepID=UPI00209D6CF6|nr:hypothetical protein [Deinococcus sp. HSC-46F16]MCP2015275.1 hypothetical protein [Deinococcus sp. HSC-46F16]
MRRLSLLLPAALLLAACGSREVKPPDAYDLSGTVSGNWGTSPRLRLALVGAGFPSAVTNDGNQEQNVVKVEGQNVWQFGLDLPRSPSLATVAGVYQVIVYNDANNSGDFNVGETFARNRQWLIYSEFGGDLPAVKLPGSDEVLIEATTVARGWNLYDRARPLGAGNPRPVTTVTGYDLSR